MRLNKRTITVDDSSIESSRKRKKTIQVTEENESQDVTNEGLEISKKSRLKKSLTVTEATKDVSFSTESKRSTIERTPFIRDSIVEYQKIPQFEHYLKIISWNVNGLKALVTQKLSILQSLIVKEQPDVLCLQETKIQHTMIQEFENLLPGYWSFWNCSTDKKGYAGTAVFLRKSTLSIRADLCKNIQTVTCEPVKKQKTLTTLWKTTSSNTPSENEEKAVILDNRTTNSFFSVENVFYDFENEKAAHLGEGRTITVETDKFFLVACYVPNSGEGLKRLEYRLKEWDPHLAKYLSALSKRKPVILTGDLNVGHLDIDIHNPEAKHIVKQAGLTPQERQSFTELLASTGFRDAFRFFYPNAVGQFTYWSQRTFARPVNRGLRLDYFICSADLFPQLDNDTPVATRPVIDRNSYSKNFGIYDSYIIHAGTVGCSDHCPIALTLAIKESQEP